MLANSVSTLHMFPLIFGNSPFPCIIAILDFKFFSKQLRSFNSLGIRSISVSCHTSLHNFYTFWKLFMTCFTNIHSAVKMSLNDRFLKLTYYLSDHIKVWHYINKCSHDILCKNNRVLVLFADKIFQLYKKRFFMLFLSLIFFF